MRLTDEQVKDAVARINTSDDNKAVIVRRALAGDPEARFAVYAAWKRYQEKAR